MCHLVGSLYTIYVFPPTTLEVDIMIPLDRYGNWDWKEIMKDSELITGGAGCKRRILTSSPAFYLLLRHLCIPGISSSLYSLPCPAQCQALGGATPNTDEEATPPWRAGTWPSLQFCELQFPSHRCTFATPINLPLLWIPKLPKPLFVVSRYLGNLIFNVFSNNSSNYS